MSSNASPQGGLGSGQNTGGTGMGHRSTTGGGSSLREYCLRWNNHQPNFVTFFSTLLSRESFVDVTLVSSEGRKIQAHKLILSACSPYFQHVFENNPCKHPIVILKDIQFADLRTIISFIYNGEVNIAQDRINNILATASTLQVKGLAEVPADELKRVGGPKPAVVPESNLASRSHPPPLRSSSPWISGSGDGDSLPSGDIPRKKLKKSSTGPGGSSSLSTNGDHSGGGSFESGVGASVSRSVDDGTGVGLDGTSNTTRSPQTSSRPGPPPLTAASQLAQQPKSRSLDTGLQLERDGGHHDSDLSSGGFSENHNYDDASALAVDRGFDLEIADVKMETASDDGELEFDEDDTYGPDGEENPDYGDSSNPYLNMPASSASFFHQSGLHFGASAAGVSKGRRGGRLLIRQPRIKRSDDTELGRESMELGGDDSSGASDGNEEMGSRPSTSSRSCDRFKRDNSFSESSVSGQQSVVPIVTVSGSSPTPPSSPLQPISQDVVPSPVTISPPPAETRRGSYALMSSTSVPPPLTTSTTTLLTIPGAEERRSSFSSGNGSTLVKQLSQPLLPSHTTVLSMGPSSSSGGHANPVIQRQHSTPNPGQSRLFPAGIKPGDLFHIVPTEGHQEVPGESTFLVDSSSGLIQIISGGEGSSRFSRPPRPGMKEMEIFSTDVVVKRESDSREVSLPRGGSVDEPSTAGESGSSFSVSLEDDNMALELPVQRSVHCPALRSGPALGCNFCWNSVDKCGRILRRKTKYHCPECHINLCIVPCFQEYHERAEKKKAKPKALLPKPSSM